MKNIYETFDSANTGNLDFDNFTEAIAKKRVTFTDKSVISMLKEGSVKMRSFGSFPWR